MIQQTGQISAMRRILVVLGILLILQGLAYAWTPSPCPATVVAKWADFHSAMLTAKPGSTIYVPHPYPKTDAEAVEDFQYTFLRIFGGYDPTTLRPTERLVVAGIRKGTLQYQVVRVDNWAPTRCGDKGELSVYLVVRAFAEGSGEELGRFALHETGIYGQGLYSPGSCAQGSAVSDGASLPPGLVQAWCRSFPPLASVLDRGQAFFGMSGAANPHYVHTFGTGELDCPPTEPCAAFTANGHSYIMGRVVPWTKPGEQPSLYELPDGAKPFAPQQVSNPTSREAILGGMDPKQERLVSLGQDGFVVARKVAPLLK